MGCLCDKILQVSDHWVVAGCSPGQSSLAAVPAGLCHIYAFVTFLLGLTPCALNGLPHHCIQVQSQKKKSKLLVQTGRCFCQMLRMIVGPPNFVEWNAPWHDIMHHWNGKAVALAQQNGWKIWSEQCLLTSLQICDACCEILRICPRTGGSSECCFGMRLVHEHGGTRGMNDWTSKLMAYMRFRQLGQRHSLAQEPALWMQLNNDIIFPLSGVLVSHCLRPKEGCLRTCRRKVKVKVT